VDLKPGEQYLVNFIVKVCKKHACYFSSWQSCLNFGLDLWPRDRLLCAIYRFRQFFQESPDKINKVTTVYALFYSGYT